MQTLPSLHNSDRRVATHARPVRADIRCTVHAFPSSVHGVRCDDRVVHAARRSGRTSPSVQTLSIVAVRRRATADARPRPEQTSEAPCTRRRRRRDPYSFAYSRNPSKRRRTSPSVQTLPSSQFGGGPPNATAPSAQTSGTSCTRFRRRTAIGIVRRVHAALSPGRTSRPCRRCLSLQFGRRTADARPRPSSTYRARRARVASRRTTRSVFGEVHAARRRVARVVRADVVVVTHPDAEAGSHTHRPNSTCRHRGARVSSRRMRIGVRSCSRSPSPGRTSRPCRRCRRCSSGGATTDAQRRPHTHPFTVHASAVVARGPGVRRSLTAQYRVAADHTSHHVQIAMPSSHDRAGAAHTHTSRTDIRHWCRRSRRRTRIRVRRYSHSRSPVSQESSVHTLPSSQFGGAPPTHAPPEQVSAVVHASESSHEAVLFALTQPEAESHESSVHTLLSSQLGGAPPTHAPPERRTRR